MSVTPEGITNPPIDDLLAVTDSKYELVIQAAKRARQINAYYSQLQEGLLENVGPLVTPKPNEKSLSTALREINEGKVVGRQPTEEDLAAALAAREAEAEGFGGPAAPAEPNPFGEPTFDTGEQA
ncbi:DNA-directed RNA polymerase subunit omega [Sediminivirga luteola]|uniref:DNA-directed RNA polymerase subunit omega n=1 Tax=Sediminivirga luteola TaxID=1774748 RepID=A0A8J2TYP8_9MICO|nr:DNA-directed RNA polymerase subunit omega [Sediminivirga luteola]MCI2264151.1 DNA-directed RNA polymerase subunit omega [Sediminivirga luteola]GGA17769.1 hypothetical protein GCM10011333_21120 [Sediminivirga luteola]